MTICSPADSTASRQALEGIRRTRQHSKVAFTIRKTVRKNDASVVLSSPHETNTRKTQAFPCVPCGEDSDLAAIILPNAALANAVLNCQIANRSVPIFELVNQPHFK